MGRGQCTLLREGDDASQHGEHNLLCQCQLCFALPRIGDVSHHPVRPVSGVPTLWAGRRTGAGHQSRGSNRVARHSLRTRALSRIHVGVSAQHRMQPTPAPLARRGAADAGRWADLEVPAGRARGGTVNRRLISSGSSFEREIGYSRAVVDGEWIFVSGTTGFDYQSMTISNSLIEQTEQCLRNIQSALEQAGASLRDVVRVTYVLPKAEDFPQCWPILRKYFGDVRPAAMMISAGLADPRMRIEIEVTARRQADR